MSKYLVASGCSYTGGGGMNNSQLFKLEFPTIDVMSFKHSYGNIDWNDTNFKNFIKPHLWPDILGKLLNYNSSYNLASGGKGIYTTINTIYHFIFEWQRSGKDVRELEIWYQIPSSNRVEVYINDEDKHKCILTEFEDSNENKKTFITKFFDEDYNLLSSIHELYKLKKYCESLNVKIHFIPWDNMCYAKTGPYFLSLKKRISLYKDDNNKSQFHKFFTNIDEVLYYDFEMMLDELGLLYINENSINQQLEQQFDKFYFEQKYPKITNDRHMTIEGQIEFAKTLERIVKKDLEN